MVINFLLGLVLFILPVIVFIPAFHAGFIWDDDQLLTQNPQVHDIWGWWTLWTHPLTADYFPLTSTTLWIEYHLGQMQHLGAWLTQLWNIDYLSTQSNLDQLDPMAGPINGYHVMNVLFHSTAVVLTWRALKRLRVPGAWVAAAIFAVHPVCVESVAWISERKNTLSQIFFVLAIIGYVRFEERGRLRFYILALISFTLALLAKTSVVMLPFMLLLLAWWRQPRLLQMRRSYNLEDSPIETAILFWSCVAVCAVLLGASPLLALQVALPVALKLRLSVPVLMIGAALVGGLVAYFGLAPNLNRDRRWNSLMGFELIRCAPFFLLALVLGAITVFFQNGRAIGTEEIPIGNWWQRIASASFASGFYLYSALWPFNIIEIYPQWHRAFSEFVHQPYPHIQPPAPESIPYWLQAVPGLIIAAVFVICWIFRGRPWARALLVGLGCYFLAILPALGLTYMSYMRLTLVADHFQYISIVAVIALVVAAGTTRSMKPLWLCAAALIFAAISWLNWKQTANNHFEEILWIAGMLVLAAAAALPQYWKYAWGGFVAAVLIAFCIVSWYQAGIYHSELTLWGTTLQKNPNSWQAHNHMGAALYLDQKWQEAYPHFKAATELKPENPESHNNLGLVYMLMGRMDDALAQFKISVQIKDDPSMETNLGNAYMEMKRYDDAERTYRHAISLNEGIPMPHRGLGFVLIQQGKTDEAINEFMKVLEIDPYMDDSRRALYALLMSKGVNLNAPVQLPNCNFDVKQAVALLRLAPGAQLAPLPQ